MPNEKNEKKTEKIKELFEKNRPALPKPRFAKFLRGIIGIIAKRAKAEFYYHFDTEEFKGKQVILLADHSSRETFWSVLWGYPFVNPNVVVGYQNLFIPVLGKLLLRGGVIPKSLYETDLRAAVDMLRLLHAGGSLCMFPEGIQSSSGANHPINPATVSLIRKAGVDVILCKSYGAYLKKPRYKSKSNRGHEEYHYEILFRADEIQNLTEEEIYGRLFERFAYNDFQWNREHGYSYKGKEPLAKGIENLLFYCPKCKSQFTIHTEKEDIVCSECKNRVTLTDKYELIPSEGSFLPYRDINEWNLDQRRVVREEIAAPDYAVEYPASYIDLHYDRMRFRPYYSRGEGSVRIDRTGLRYVGTKDGKQVDLFYDIGTVPSTPFVPGKRNNLYFHNVYYGFAPKDDPKKSVKYMLIMEELHRLVDPAWEKASADAYVLPAPPEGAPV